MLPSAILPIKQLAMNDKTSSVIKLFFTVLKAPLRQHPHLRFFSLEKGKNYFRFLVFSLGMDDNKSFTVISNFLDVSLFVINTAKYLVFFALICSFAAFKTSD